VNDFNMGNCLLPLCPLYTSKQTAAGLNKVSIINVTVSFEALNTKMKFTLLYSVH
jgi:hypothetical protein